jgi:putative lipoprotein
MPHHPFSQGYHPMTLEGGAGLQHWRPGRGTADRLSAALALLVLLLSLLTATTAMAGLATIEGTAVYRERMALPEGAVLEVELLDISRANAPAVRLASLRLQPQGQVPIPFTLHYDPALIDERYSYAVSARILHDGRLLFVSDTIHPVLTRGAGDTVEVGLVRVAAGRPEPAAPGLAGPALVGPVWIAEDIDRRGVIDNLQSHVRFWPDGRVEGSGGCNVFSGGYRLDGDQLEIGSDGFEVATTLRACPPAVMDQEARFMDALTRVRAWRVERGLLFLLDADGQTISRLWKRQP